MPHIVMYHRDGAMERVGYGRDKGDRQMLQWPEPLEMDLVEEAEWEEHLSTVPLEAAGLEEDDPPEFGGESTVGNGMFQYLDWFYDDDVETSLG